MVVVKTAHDRTPARETLFAGDSLILLKWVFSKTGFSKWVFVKMGFLKWVFCKRSDFVVGFWILMEEERSGEKWR